MMKAGDYFASSYLYDREEYDSERSIKLPQEEKIEAHEAKLEKGSGDKMESMEEEALENQDSSNEEDPEQ